MSLRQLRFLIFSGFKNKLVFADDEISLSAKKNENNNNEVFELKSVENELKKDESSTNNKVCVKEVDWEKLNILKECQDFYKVCRFSTRSKLTVKSGYIVNKFINVFFNDYFFVFMLTDEYFYKSHRS